MNDQNTIDITNETKERTLIDITNETKERTLYDPKYDPKLEAFKYQIEFLKLEFNCINEIIARMDEMAQATKNWAIVTWAGSIAIVLGQPDLRKFVVFTSILPFLFWFIDAFLRHLQRRSTYRTKVISNFLNNNSLQQSFENQQLTDFIVLDPTAIHNRNEESYKEYTSVWRALNFDEVKYFYLGLVGLSMVLGIIAFYLF